MRPNAFLAFLLPAALSPLLACGGSAATATGEVSPGEFGSLSGTVAGITFNVASVIGGFENASATAVCATSIDAGQTCTTTTSGEQVGVLLTNRADATCSYIQREATSSAGLSLANYDVLQLTVTSPTGAVTPGTYSLATTTGASLITAQAILATTGTTCFDTSDNWASYGTITLTEVSTSVLAGTYDVTFSTQGSFNGSFKVDVCYLTDAGVAPSDGGGAICEP